MRFVLMLIVLASVSTSARADRILMIGDSLSCGPFGRRVVENLKAAGNSVTLYCSIGSAPANWINGTNPYRQICQTMNSSNMNQHPCEPHGAMPKLADLLKQTPADKVIVALGTNSLPDGPTASPIYQQMASMVRSKGACQWIGPPRLNPSQAIGWSSHKRGSPEDLEMSRQRITRLEQNLDGFYNSLTAKVDGICPLVDSRPATATGPAHETEDGIHRGTNAGRIWASALSHQIGTIPSRARSSGGSRSSN